MKELRVAIWLPGKPQKSYKFFVVGLTYGCLNPWIEIIGMSTSLQCLARTLLMVEL